MACKPGTVHFIASQIIRVIQPVMESLPDFNPSSHHVYSFWRLNTYIYISIYIEMDSYWIPIFRNEVQKPCFLLSQCVQNAYNSFVDSVASLLGEDGLIWWTLIIWGFSNNPLPSGKHTKNYGKFLFFLRKFTISMVMFHSYVKKNQRVR